MKKFLPITFDARECRQDLLALRATFPPLFVESIIDEPNPTVYFIVSLKVLPHASFKCLSDWEILSGLGVLISPPMSAFGEILSSIRRFTCQDPMMV